MLIKCNLQLYIIYMEYVYMYIHVKPKHLWKACSYVVVVHIFKQRLYFEK